MIVVVKIMAVVINFKPIYCRVLMQLEVVLHIECKLLK